MKMVFDGVSYVVIREEVAEEAYDIADQIWNTLNDKISKAYRNGKVDKSQKLETRRHKIGLIMEALDA